MLKKNLKIHNDTAMILYPLYSAADEADHSPGGIYRGRSVRRTGERLAHQILDARDVGACTYVAT